MRYIFIIIYEIQNFSKHWVNFEARRPDLEGSRTKGLNYGPVDKRNKPRGLELRRKGIKGAVGLKMGLSTHQEGKGAYRDPKSI
jgi:hypothetical protein